MFALGLMILGGALLPVQTTINSRLRLAVISPYLSSLISFIVGTVFLAVLALLVDGAFWFSPSEVAGEPAWIWAGGLLGAIVLTTNILIFPRLGGVQSVILPITGQVLMSLIIDQFGIFRATQVDLTVARVIGAVLVIAGVIAAVALGRKKAAPVPGASKEVSAPASNLGWQLLAIFVGFLMASQAAINGHLGIVIGSGIKAAFISFIIGTIVLFLLVLGLRLKLKVTVPAEKKGNPWWMWIGGLLGAGYVTLNAVLVPILGVGTTTVASLTGMIIASLIIDKFGIFEAARRPVRLIQVAGIVVMIIGVALIRLT
ncbi:DMT family transporter [Rothia aerolata]|uniref:Membrane protein n=1 Tax=Rothia aerolata TaxID=1812262 RepID=A0A917IPT7_9MICC|nr:DMT family transporter [Rothia aerolata]GGH60034.1 membrane protein [Rothia aerolata]